MAPRANINPGEIVFDRAVDAGFQLPGPWFAREWLDVGGTGAYASSSLADTHTRKYHGLLVAAPQGMGKHVFLSRLDACWVKPDGTEFPLYTNLHPGAMVPGGVDLLRVFRQGPCPQWFWQAGDFKISRSLMMHESLPAVLFRFEGMGGAGHLRLIPRLAFRDMHHLTRENAFLQGATRVNGPSICFSPYDGLPDLHLSFTGNATFIPAPHWLRRIELPREAERGFDALEDLFTPGHLDIALVANTPIHVCASLENPLGELAMLWSETMGRRRLTWEKNQSEAVGSAQGQLRFHGRQFLVHADGHDGICAGYPWFGQWGRDAMIALPGLTVASGRPEAALQVLRSFAGARKNGLIPNYLNADGRHAYNSVDASLWFFRAVQSYLLATRDREGVARYLGEAMVDILTTFAEGRAPHVRCTEAGLIWVGHRGTQLTWMDAEVHGQPVTPRHGMAVELNALWFNALQFVLEFQAKNGAPVPPVLASLTASIQANFTLTFAPGPWPWLADTVNEEGPDFSLRPNQIFAVALPHSPLSLETRRAVVKAVGEHLVTPFGLRTLSPLDPRFRGRYEGDSANRDSAYHQGTVWPWLTGAYVDGALAVSADRSATARELLTTFGPLFEEARRHYGVGGIAEIYDGAPPHRPAGCISQAWSVAEVIRAQSALAEAL